MICRFTALWYKSLQFIGLVAASVGYPGTSINSLVYGSAASSGTIELE